MRARHVDPFASVQRTYVRPRPPRPDAVEADATLPPPAAQEPVEAPSTGAALALTHVGMSPAAEALGMSKRDLQGLVRQDVPWARKAENGRWLIDVVAAREALAAR